MNKDDLELNPPAGKSNVDQKPLRTPAELVAAHDKAVAEAREVLRKTNEDHLMKPWKLLVSGKTVSEDPEFVTLVFELFTLSRRNEDIAVEYAGLMRRTREKVAGMLAAGQREGILRLHAEPEVVAEILFSLGDGFALRMLSEPERDFTATIDAGIECARALLTD